MASDKDKFNLTSETPSVAPKTVEDLMSSFKETQEIFNTGFKEVLEQLTKMKFSDVKEARKFVREVKEGQIDPIMALRLLEKTFKKILPLQGLENMFKVASRNVSSGKSLDQQLNYLLSRVHKLKNPEQYNRLFKAQSVSNEANINSTNKKLNDSITKNNILKSLAAQSQNETKTSDLISKNFQKEFIRKGGGRGNVIYPMVPYAPYPNFKLKGYSGPTKSAYHSKKFEIVPYNQLNSFQTQRVKSVLTPRAFSDFHAGAPIDFSRATEGIFNGRKTSSFANPIDMQAWMNKQEVQHQSHLQKIIDDVNDKFKGIHDSPEARKWTKKFIGSLMSSLKNLPMFKVIEKAGSDLLRFGLLKIAGNQNLPEPIRKAALAGVGLQVPESIMKLGGFGMNILANVIGTNLFNVAGKFLNKFGLNIFKGGEIAQLEKRFGLIPKAGGGKGILSGLKTVGKLSKLGKLTPLGIPLLLLDLLDPLAEKTAINGPGPTWMKKGNLAMWHGLKGAANGAYFGGMFGGLPGAAIGGIIGGIYGIWKGISTDISDIKEGVNHISRDRTIWDNVGDFVRQIGGSGGSIASGIVGSYAYANPTDYSVYRDKAKAFRNMSYNQDLLRMSNSGAFKVGAGEFYLGPNTNTDSHADTPYLNKAFGTALVGHINAYAQDYKARTGDDFVATLTGALTGPGKTAHSKGKFGDISTSHFGGFKADLNGKVNGVYNKEAVDGLVTYLESLGYTVYDEAKGTYANPNDRTLDVSWNKNVQKDVNNALKNKSIKDTKVEDLTSNALDSLNTNNATRNMLMGMFDK